jgi:hypothetical protein
MPVAVAIRTPARIYARRPAPAVAIRFNPITIIVQVIEARYIAVDVTVACRARIRVIIIRVIQIAIIGAVSPVVLVRVAIAVVIIDYASGKIGRKLREQDRGGSLSGKSQNFARADLACPRKPDYLRKPAQDGDPGIAVIAIPYLIETGFHEIYRAVRGRYLKQLIITEIAEVEKRRPVP